MDDRRIDTIARALAASRSRRAALGAATALVAGTTSAVPNTTAKKKKRCKTIKCFGQCIPSGAECCFIGGGWCEPGVACCNDGCMPDMATCCTDGSGGFCGYRETCCPPAQGLPDGFCGPPGSNCCRDGYCDMGNQCCPPLILNPGGWDCAIPGQTFCCPAPLGGGHCDFGDQCCGPTYDYPNGFCAPNDYPCSWYLSRDRRALVKLKSRSNSAATASQISPRLRTAVTEITTAS